MKDATTNLGESAQLSCQIVGRPLPDITWYRFGKELVQSRKYKMSSDGRTHTLTVLTEEQEDEGLYTCKATNDVGEVETSGKLLLQASPQFHPGYPLKEKYYAGVGSTLRLHIMYIGRPVPAITWFHGQKLLKSGENIAIENTEHYTHLVIKNVQHKTHAGKYKVQLSNIFGTVDTVLNVEIQGNYWLLVVLSYYYMFSITLLNIFPFPFEDKPDKPAGPIVVEALLKNSSVISWKPPEDDGGAPITNYVVEKREAKEGTEWQLVSSSISGTTCRIVNLIENAGYYFRVFAQNTFGISEPLEVPSVVIIKTPFGK